MGCNLEYLKFYILRSDETRNVKIRRFSVKTAKKVRFNCPLRVSLASDHKIKARIMFLVPKYIKKSYSLVFWLQDYK